MMETTEDTQSTLYKFLYVLSVNSNFQFLILSVQQLQHLQVKPPKLTVCNARSVDDCAHSCTVVHM